MDFFARRAASPARCLAFLALGLVPTVSVRAEDCNGNGVEDAVDLTPALRLGASVKLATARGGASAVAVEDLDGDLDEDLVLAAPGTNELEALLNDGKGGFVLGGTYLTVGLDAHAIATGDFDVDGDADVATADFGSASISLLRNSGDATFDPAEAAAELEQGSNPSDLAAADVDGDGDLDLVATVDFYDPTDEVFGRKPGYVLVLINDAGEAFHPLDLVPRATGIRPVELSLGDINQDGDPDLAVACSVSGTVDVFDNDGGGEFAPVPGFPLEQASSVSRADLDKDGDDDWIAAGAHRRVVMLNGEGGAVSSLDEEDPAGPRATAAIDVDFDGNIDACFAAGGILAVRTGAGDGSLASLDWSFVTGVESPARLTTGDLDGDGDLDLVLRAIDGGVSSVLLLETADGSGFVVPEVHESAEGPSSVAVRDLDADGWPDLVVACGKGGALALYRSAGDGTFTPGPRVATGSGSYSVICDDLDGDGSWDTAVGIADPKGERHDVAVFWSSGGAPGDARLYPVPPQPIYIAAADLDGDGKLEIAVAHGAAGVVSILWNEGSRDLSGPASFLAGANLAAVAAGDLDGDGRLDLIATGGEGEVSILRNAGKRNFAQPATVRVDVEAGDYPFNAALADWNGDGALDIAVPRSRTSIGGEPGTVSLLVNRGGGTFEDPRPTEVGPFPRSVAAGDVDGDGVPDLVVARSNAVSLLRGVSGGFGPPFSWSAGGRGPVHVALADVDSDGRIDVVAADAFSNEVSVIRNDTLPPASRDADRNGVPDECTEALFHRGDADANGKLELTDAIRVVLALFAGGGPLACGDAADSDDSGGVDITDAIRVLGFLFQGVGSIPPPGPPGQPCGPDSTPAPDLDCASYDACGS